MRRGGQAGVDAQRRLRGRLEAEVAQAERLEAGDADGQAGHLREAADGGVDAERRHDRDAHREPRLERAARDALLEVLGVAQARLERQAPEGHDAAT